MKSVFLTLPVLIVFSNFAKAAGCPAKEPERICDEALYMSRYNEYARVNETDPRCDRATRAPRPQPRYCYARSEADESESLQQE